jgi:hypothetical protein
VLFREASNAQGARYEDTGSLMKYEPSLRKAPEQFYVTREK